MVDTRGEFGDLLGIFVPVLLAVVALVFGAVLFAVVRYRRRPQTTPADGRRDHRLAESAWLLVLAVAAGLLIAATFRSNDRVRALVAEPGLVVEVAAFQWGWSFAYPAGGVRIEGSAPQGEPTLVVPTDTTIRFELTSRDVIHAFWVPHARFKLDAFPNHVNRFDLVFREAGLFQGNCAEFCGLRHHSMGFRVRALPPADFERWLAREAAA